MERATYCSILLYYRAQVTARVVPRLLCTYIENDTVEVCVHCIRSRCMLVESRLGCLSFLSFNIAGVLAACVCPSGSLCLRLVHWPGLEFNGPTRECRCWRQLVSIRGATVVSCYSLTTPA